MEACETAHPPRGRRIKWEYSSLDGSTEPGSEGSVNISFYSANPVYQTDPWGYLVGESDGSRYPYSRQIVKNVDTHPHNCPY